MARGPVPPEREVLLQLAEGGFKGRKRWFQGNGKMVCSRNIKLMGEDTENKARKRGTVKSDVYAEGIVFGYFLLQGVNLFGSVEWRIDTLTLIKTIR